MVQAYCIHCEPGNNIGRNGYIWIHPRCYFSLFEITGDVKELLKIIQEKGIDDPEVISYIKQAVACFKRSEGVMAAYKELTEKASSGGNL